MKRLYILFSLMCLFALSNAQETERKSQTRNVGSFNKIITSKGINLTLIEGNDEKVRIEIENGDVTDVVTEIKGRDLHVKLKTKIYSHISVQVYVTYKSIASLLAGTGSFITNEGTLHAENLDLKASTGSSIVLNLNAQNITASCVSSKIELAGKADFQEVSSSTGGKYIADHLICNESIIKASTGGSAMVNTTESLDMKTSTGGKIYYTGNPKKLVQKGNVEKIQE